MEKPKTIFLVDDDGDDRMLIGEAIQNLSKSVVIREIENGYELLELLNAEDGEKPELILIDMNMPQINGLETLFKLRQNLDNRHIPVLMISTASNKELVLEAYRMGVNAFIPKPVTLAEYESLAQAVNLCFLNYPQISEGDIHPVSGNNAANVIIIEDNDDHWNLMNLAIRQSTQKLNLIRLRDKNSTLDFLDNCYKNLVPAPKLILLDLYLPSRKHGLGLLESIRYFLSINNLADIPIIVFSNSNYRKDMDACYEKQANAYIVKPADVTVWPHYFTRLFNLWAKTIRFPNTNP
jgi:CheY-like chemotaxis protein